MTLRDCLSKVSHREYLLWQKWFKEEWDRPTKTDWYLMQLTAETVKVDHPKPEMIETEHYRLKFESKIADEKEKTEPQGLTKKQVEEYQLLMWKTKLGMKDKNNG